MRGLIVISVQEEGESRRRSERESYNWREEKVAYFSSIRVSRYCFTCHAQRSIMCTWCFDGWNIETCELKRAWEWNNVPYSLCTSEWHWCAMYLCLFVVVLYTVSDSLTHRQWRCVHREWRSVLITFKSKWHSLSQWMRHEWKESVHVYHWDRLPIVHASVRWSLEWYHQSRGRGRRGIRMDAWEGREECDESDSSRSSCECSTVKVEWNKSNAAAAVSETGVFEGRMKEEEEKWGQSESCSRQWFDGRYEQRDRSRWQGECQMHSSAHHQLKGMLERNRKDTTTDWWWDENTEKVGKLKSWLKVAVSQSTWELLFFLRPRWLWM